MTLRALDALREVDVIAAEDTRVTQKLLHHHGIKARLIAAHEHNERRSATAILSLLAQGKRVALVCDAGTPAISDPGARIVAAVRAEGYPVTPIPGPNAAVAALSAAGCEAPHFLFYGFLPAKQGARRRAIGALARLPFTLVFYEAPHRVHEALEDLAAVLGPERGVVVAREITKQFESIHTCLLGDAAAWIAADLNRAKGEFVLIVDGAPVSSSEAEAEGERVLTLLLDALPVKQAVAMAAKITGASRNLLYRRALALKGEPD